MCIRDSCCSSHRATVLLPLAIPPVRPRRRCGPLQRGEADIGGLESGRSALRIAASEFAAAAVTHPWHPIPGGVTAPQGFLAAGITAGLKASGKPDLSLLLAPEGAVCAGTFTTSLVRAACVDLCAERLQSSGGRARAVLTNSGTLPQA